MTPERLLAALPGTEAHVCSLERQHAEIVAASRDANADDEHDPEGATIAFEREQVAALLASARRTCEDLRQALDRTAQGTYGRCEDCGERISDARLEARPTARTCIVCAGRRR